MAGRGQGDAGGIAGDDAGSGRRVGAGVDGAGRAWMLLRRVDERGGEWLGPAFLSLVVGAELPSGAGCGCSLGGRARAGGGAWFDAGTDCVSTETAAAVWRAGAAGVSGERG